MSSVRSSGRVIGTVVTAALLASIAVTASPRAPRAAAQTTPSTAVPEVDTSGAIPFADGEVLVKYRSNRSEVTKEQVRSSVGATGATTVSPQATDVEKLELPAEVSVAEAVATLRTDPNVAAVEPNYRAERFVTSNDNRFGDLWGMQGTTSSPANTYGSRAADAWAAGRTGSSSVHVVVIDEGIDVGHPDLAANIWTNPYEIAGNGIDDDNNGYIDDVNGWDFAQDDNVVTATGDSHGTHVAGTIGAVGGNEIGVAGVSWDVTLISARFLGSGPYGGWTTSAIAAIDYATDLKVRHGINIVATNNSWGGGGYSSLLLDAIERRGPAGILFVAAAGNGGEDGVGDDNDTQIADTATSNPPYPANYTCTRGGTRSYDCVIAVAALKSNGTRDSYSNYGATTVDLGAPGTSIVSTVDRSTGSEYATKIGTSMATPHVTGAIALCASLGTSIGPSAVRSLLMSTTVATPSLSGITVTGGRLDVGAFTSQCAAVPPTPYTCSAATYAWDDIVGTGTQRVLADDAAVEVPVGFTFSFYGVNRSTAWVGSNGLLGLAEAPFPAAFTAGNDPVPSPSPANGAAFAYWDDLDPSVGGSVWTRTLGSAPNRRFVTTWSDVPRWVQSGPASGGVTFQAVIWESTGALTFRYQDTAFSDGSYPTTYDNGASATIGVEAPSGTVGTQVSFNTATRAASTAVTCGTTLPPTITTTSVPSASRGVAYSTTLVASDGVAPVVWSIPSGTLPAGLSLSTTGVLAGTPTTPGTTTVTVAATDAIERYDEQVLSITVNPLFGIVQSSLPTATRNSAYTTTLTTLDGTTPVSWAVIGGALPAGLTLATNGTISGTPTSAGSSSVTIRATDAAAATASRTFSLTVALDGTPASRYITSTYQLFVGRPATTAEVSTWSPTVQAGNRYPLTSALAVSDGWAGYEIDQLYQIVLGRGADPSGRAYWVSQVAAGVRLETIATFYYGGPEYYSANGSTPAGYVTALYEDILRRQPDQSGLNFWVGMLNSGALDRYGVAASFYASIESRRDRVNRLYLRILGRGPDPGGWDYWAGQLLTTGDVALAVLLAGSDEYYTRTANGG